MYFSDRPREFSTGYLSAFAFIFRETAAARSTPQVMAQVGQQHADICKLGLDCIASLVDDLGHIGVFGPDEVLQQLGRLHGQGGCRASSIVKLRPVTLGAKGQQALGEPFTPSTAVDPMRTPGKPALARV